MAAPLALTAGARREEPKQTAVLAVLLLVGSSVMFIGGLVAAWVNVKGLSPTWPPKDVEALDHYPGAMMLTTALMASVTAEWGVWAVRRSERRQAVAALGTTIGLALAFVNGIWYIGSHLGAGPGESAYAAMFHAFVVATIVLGLAGIVALAVALGRVLASQVDVADPEALVPQLGSGTWPPPCGRWSG